MLLGSQSTLQYVSKPSYQNFRRKIHHKSESICHTKFLHSALQSAHPKTYMCRYSRLFKHIFPVKIEIFFKIFLLASGKNFTFCWFWLGTLHQNGLSGMYIGFQLCWIQWHWFEILTISSSWNIKTWGEKYIKWVKNHQNRMGPMQQCF